MKVQSVSNYTNQYSANNSRQKGNNPNFGRKGMFQGELVLETVFGEDAAKRMAPHVKKWIDFLARKGARITLEREGDHVAVSVSKSNEAISSANGQAFASGIHSWKDGVKMIAAAARDFLRGDKTNVTCNRSICLASSVIEQ